MSRNFLIKLKANSKLLHIVSVRRCCTSPKNGFTVTVLDGCHKVGRHTALILKQSPLISELRLHDIDSTICFVAEDLSHIDTRTKVKSFCGQSVLKNAVADADIVVCLGGCRSKISETCKDLFEKNVDAVRTAAWHCIEFSPKAIFCIAKPPIEAFVPLVTEEYKKAGVHDYRKIIGISSVACMRSNSFIGLISGQDSSQVRCPVVGGASKGCVVACISQTKPEQVHPQHHKIIQDSIAISEDEVLKAYHNRGTSCLAAALAISRFVNCQLKALNGETNCVDCAFVKQTGHIGQFLPYMTSIVRLGRHGLLSAHMPKINGYEAHCLKRAALYIKDYIKLGETFVTGERKGIKEIKSEITKAVKCN
ncbi:malate dehydrogenase, mitochondrial-like [Sitophilus oryzae]|uniref:Malate dehydrogenase, mitochondrial n=1 Tax=Sitophilus oryzae TaxID=7048 RepID=A0A6J2X3R4_SITOR|nr:malate dehydrogenase, mitochondrial-like [Sitophilus oryzae]